MSNTVRKSRGYFIDEAGTTAFNTAFTLMLAQHQKKIVSEYMPPENTQRFRHGGAWSHPGAPDVIGSGMQTHSAVIETRFQDLIDNDLDAIGRSMRQLIESIRIQFVQMLYSTLAEACDQTGNTVDAKAEGSLENAFMAMMEKIQFVADKSGKVSLPEIHVAPETGARMMAALEAAPPEYIERLEAVKARKIADALAREVERKAKFARYGDDA